VPLDIAVERITSARAKLKYYEAGMDLNLSENINESFKLFQGRILDEYDKMVDEFGLIKIDGTLQVKDQQRQVRNIIKKVLKDWEGLPNPNKVPITLKNPQAADKGKGEKK
jgi:dTMP kinase